ncbi:MAG: 4Fe-4S dicluster domain-containing protein [Candidatus Omnitrophota bacterium]
MVIFKPDIASLLRAVASRFRVYFPRREPDGDCHFVRLERGDDAGLDGLRPDYDNLVVPPKSILFPQLQTMFDFAGRPEAKGKGRLLPRLIFGVRACDWKGMLFCDGFFKRNIPDTYYLDGIKNRLVIVVGCLRPPREDRCFCAAAKTGPFLDQGYDLQLVDLGDAYFVEIGSLAGRRFVERYAAFFRNARRRDVSAAGRAKRRAFRNIRLRPDLFAAIKKMQKAVAGLESVYERIGQRCIYCAGCLYVCPTCTCFNVFDYPHSRMRNWDACIFEGYMRQAGGHNPRKEKWQRAARRYEHKLKYDYQNTGVCGCVGCGRCLDTCPVNIGMSEFIKELRTTSLNET